MQGTILSIASRSNQGIILGDDGVRYTYTTFGWRDSTAADVQGLRVDFDARGSHALGIYPLPGAVLSPYANPAVAPGPFRQLPPTYPSGGIQTPAQTPHASVQPHTQPGSVSFNPPPSAHAPISPAASTARRPPPPEIPLKGNSTLDGARWALIGLAALFVIVIAGAAYWYSENGSTAGRELGTSSDAPPDFIANDPELNRSYERASLIMNDPGETEESRQRKLRVMHQEVGPDTMSLLLSHVPVLDLETGEIGTFGAYMRETVSSHGHSDGSPIDVDPVGAGMRILFDPSPENITQMTGIGLSDSERQEVLDKFTTDQARTAETVRQVISSIAETADGYDSASQEASKGADRVFRGFDADRASREADRAVREVSREVDRAIQEFDTDRASREVDRAMQGASRGVSDAIDSLFGGN